MPTCRHKRQEIDCDYCFTSVTWAIVKDAKGMRETGHDATVRWARAYLGLEDRPEVRGSRRTHDETGRTTK
jgi:hypothetical protein